MKKLLLLLLCLPIIGLGQVTSPSVVSISGDSYSNTNIIMDYTLGEIAVETHTKNLSYNKMMLVIQIKNNIHEDRSKSE